MFTSEAGLSAGARPGEADARHEVVTRTLDGGLAGVLSSYAKGGVESDAMRDASELTDATLTDMMTGMEMMTDMMTGKRDMMSGRDVLTDALGGVMAEVCVREILDNLLVRIHFISVMIWWTGLAP